MRTLNEVLYNGSSDTSFQSTTLPLEYQLGFSIQVKITGNAVGTMNLQGSDDFGVQLPGGPDNGNKVATWTDIFGSYGPVTEDGSFTWNVESCFYKWVRVNYVSSSGSGSSMLIRANTKGF